tara:strand:+ start:299 stop:658 length:360 start_codon:yes stop_codon:yes gene_type:complete
MALAKTGLGAVVECNASADTPIIAVGSDNKKIYVRGLLIFNQNEVLNQTCEIYVMNDHSGSEQNKAASNKIGRLTLTAGDTAFFEFPYPLTLTTEHDRILIENESGAKVNVLPIGDKES